MRTLAVLTIGLVLALAPMPADSAPDPGLFNNSATIDTSQVIDRTGCNGCATDEVLLGTVYRP